MVVLATLSETRRPPEVSQSLALALMAGTAVVALLAASVEVRFNRAVSWSATRCDPFLVFAAAIVLLAAPRVTAVVQDPTSHVFHDHGWLTGGLAALLGAVGFLVMIRDLTPGRGLDALFLAAIGSTTTLLFVSMVVLSASDTQVSISSAAFARLGLVALDLLVVGLGLQALHLRARARRDCWLFVLAWTFVLITDVTDLLVELTGDFIAVGPMVVVGLLVYILFAVAAVSRDPVELAEPVIGSLRRLPRSQVALLRIAVLLGPSISVALRERVALPLVVPLSGVLSLLVVTYLVRLVQGRALLEHRAHHDELTGLANRRLFEERAAGAISFARRTGGHSAVLFLDLDRFKNVNDSLGHTVGNQLLQAVAKRLNGATRAEDTVARLGGDEFVVLLPQLDDPDEAAAVAEKILGRFEEPFALESQLHTAAERGELRLQYQPKVHLPTARVTGMEALLRWEHPELGLLQPAEFIPLAEESGLIVTVGEWALEEACRQNQAWLTAGYTPLVVAVNLSLRQFQHQRVEDMTARILRSTGMDPTLLELEITESLATQDPEDVSATLFDLKALGVTCSIDDFATGYSGLNHLAAFPIDKLKIDKSFVATIDTDREAPIIVAVVALAHGLGLTVVAEGVETAEQLERLRELGCDEMQGFLFSRPLAPDAFEILLEAESTIARRSGLAVAAG